MNQDFREFIQSLNDNQVRYLVIGGYAVSFHGYPRYTKDLDIWIWLFELADVGFLDSRSSDSTGLSAQSH
jgi:predicted nucleotidyltransferase